MRWTACIGWFWVMIQAFESLLKWEQKMGSIQLPGNLKKKKNSTVSVGNIAHLAVGVLWGDYVAPDVFFLNLFTIIMGAQVTSDVRT